MRNKNKNTHWENSHSELDSNSHSELDLKKIEKNIIKLLARVDSWEIEYDKVMFGLNNNMKGGLV